MRNGDVGCQFTRNAILSLLKYGGADLEGRIGSLFEYNPHIEVDFSKMSPEQGRVVLRVLRNMARTQSCLLQNVRLNVDLDLPSAELMNEIDQTITAIRETDNGKYAAFTFECCRSDEEVSDDEDSNVEDSDVENSSEIRTTPPDFSQWPNLTSIKLTGCYEMIETPNFSKNPYLKSVVLSNCIQLMSPPDFSNNPWLRSVFMLEWEGLVIEPDFSRNQELESVKMTKCRELTTAPDFSHNLNLKSAIFIECEQLTVGSDFSQNAELTVVRYFNCGRLMATSDFSLNPKLEWLDLRFCNLSDEDKSALKYLLGDRVDV